MLYPFPKCVRISLFDHRAHLVDKPLTIDMNDDIIIVNQTCQPAERTWLAISIIDMTLSVRYFQPGQGKLYYPTSQSVFPTRTHQTYHPPWGPQQYFLSRPNDGISNHKSPIC